MGTQLWISVAILVAATFITGMHWGAWLLGHRGLWRTFGLYSGVTGMGWSLAMITVAV